MAGGSRPGHSAVVRMLSGRPRGPGRVGRASPTALHETRKAVKDARYAAEAARPAVGKKARRISRRMKKMQGTLGDHHDAVVARDTVRDIGVRAHLAGENAFSFGVLHGQFDRDALALEERALQRWPSAFRPRSS